MELGAVCCLLYPFAALYLIRRRVARKLAAAALGIDLVVRAPRPRVLGFTVGLAVFCLVYWYLVGVACRLGAGFRTPDVTLPYLAVLSGLLSLNVWLASKQQLAWHRRHQHTRT